ncbi:hypothetical protein L596_010336 [Steinernema carpocapsae]|uniref:MATH domain-containing protein n=1 Tax=Steinernema carpocapsae TaxID=34508 RepID=A0A4U5PJD0_STECR|nr:hypothetical protein L596_010336 [Steinernema carpocapsae]
MASENILAKILTYVESEEVRCAYLEKEVNLQKQQVKHLEQQNAWISETFKREQEQFEQRLADVEKKLRKVENTEQEKLQQKIAELSAKNAALCVEFQAKEAALNKKIQLMEAKDREARQQLKDMDAVKDCGSVGATCNDIAQTGTEFCRILVTRNVGLPGNSFDKEQRINNFEWAFNGYYDKNDEELNVYLRCEWSSNRSTTLWKCTAKFDIYVQKAGLMCSITDTLTNFNKFVLKTGLKGTSVATDEFADPKVLFIIEVTILDSVVDLSLPDNEFLKGPNDGVCVKIADQYVTRQLWLSKTTLSEHSSKFETELKESDCFELNSSNSLSFMMFLSVMHNFTPLSCFDDLSLGCVIREARQHECDSVLKKCDYFLCHYESVFTMGVKFKWAVENNLVQLLNKLLKTLHFDDVRRYASCYYLLPESRDRVDNYLRTNSRQLS